MKTNKGFAPVAIVLIIIAVLALGGVVYYVKKSSTPAPQNTPENNYQPPANQNTTVINPPITTPPSPSTSSTTTTSTYIKVDPSSYTVDSKAYSMAPAFNVISNADWTGSSNQTWVTLLTKSGTANGSGPGEHSTRIGLSWIANPLTTSRTALLTFTTGTQKTTFTLTQNGRTAVNPVSTVLPIPYIFLPTALLPWPPLIQNSGTAYSCKPPTNSEMGEVIQKVIGGRNYCIITQSEGALGRKYNTYTYITASSNGNGIKTTTFALVYENCGAYSGLNQTQCQTAQSNFNLDAIVDSLFL